MANAYVSHPNFGMYIGNGFRLNDKTGALKPFAVHGLGFDRRALKEGLDYVQQPSAFFLREAWQQVGGLDAGLNFSLDWDLIIRIASEYPVVLSNEFLSLSREYTSTKTASGGLERCVELCEIGRRHTGQTITLGALGYLLDTLHNRLGGRSPEVRKQLYVLMSAVEQELASIVGDGSGFPCSVEAGDVVYVPRARTSSTRHDVEKQIGLPRISVVIASDDRSELSAQAIESVVAQDYPELQLIVMSNSSDGETSSKIMAAAYAADLCERHPEQSLARLIKEEAEGEVLVWLEPGVLLAAGALQTVGQMFRNSPSTDAVFGNTAFINSSGNPAVARAAGLKTSWHSATVPAPGQIARFWTNSRALLQPTVFVRRGLFERLGGLNESHAQTYNLEFMLRLQARTTPKKIERILALVNLDESEGKAAHGTTMTELFRLARPLWPRGRKERKEISRAYAADFAQRAVGTSRALPRRLARLLLRFTLRPLLFFPKFNPERLVANRAPRA